MTAEDEIPVTGKIRLVRYRKDNDESEVENIQSFRQPKLRTDQWLRHITKRSLNVLSTHVIQFDIGSMKEEGRARHRRNQILPMMIFGVTALGMIMIPIGFQLLAVLGGKALLLSKMALLLASVNGLRKVASSGIHYGLYHADHPHHGPFERSETYMHQPRKVHF